MTTASWLPWIPGLPLLSFLVLITGGRRLGRAGAWLSVGALACSGWMAVSLAPAVLHGERVAASWAWLSSSAPLWRLGLAVDGLSWVMLILVTGIGTLIQLYSIGYMRGDPRFSRFFAYLSLFCASMLLLVLADHFVWLYAGWELVGLCSYLLISFWFEKPAAAAAGRKAFLTTRIGDTGLLLGILWLAFAARELHFSQLEAIRDAFLVQHQAWALTGISTLIFFGAVGKSAQIPLHVWLPDAMEGPTPVSALIHAATMVAAGVYLVARTFVLFTPQSLQVVFTLGLLTHLLAGTVALTQTDIKRVLAYSTLSQLGFMMVALGLGAIAPAMFHLTTHAFFKALLFLAAGSVIHATHQQELEHLGGLGSSMPWTRAVFLIAALAMGGFPLLSGFWSKDAVLLAAREQQPWVMWALLGGAVMTSCYIFRLYFRCFHGRAPQAHGHEAAHRAHESPWIMVAPMAVLAVGAALIGLAGSSWLGAPFLHLLGEGHAHEGLDMPIVLGSIAALAIGVSLAWTVGVQRRNLLPAGLRPLGHRLYRLAYNKYYVDELYDRAIIRPFLGAAQALARFDGAVIDGAVNGAGRLGAWVGACKAWVDRVLIDGAVNGVARAVQAVSVAGRRLQTGVVHHYLLWIVAALAAVLMVRIR